MTKLKPNKHRYTGPTEIPVHLMAALLQLLEFVQTGEEEHKFTKASTTLTRFKQHMLEHEQYECLCTFRDMEEDLGITIPL